MNEGFKSDPRADTPEGLIAGVTILARYMPKGMQQKSFTEAGNGAIWFTGIAEDAVLKGSDDARVLNALGFRFGEFDCWELST